MRISLIAALSRNRVIGKDNQLPWHLPDDLKHFRAITSGHPVIMGRKTFESIGRPLPGRFNVVITRGGPLGSVTTVNSLEAAFSACEGKPGSEELFVIGGAEIYRQTLPRADRLYLTLIDEDVEGDALFPEWNPAEFQEISRCAGEGLPPHHFHVLDRLRS